MTKSIKRIWSMLLSVVAVFALSVGIASALPEKKIEADAATSYTVKETAFMAYIDNCYAPNGNFYLVITLSELDTSIKQEGVAYDTTVDDMPTMFRQFDFFNKVKINGYTLAELGCNTVWENAFDVNAGSGAPMYKLRFHMHADPTTWNNAINSGKVTFGVGSNVTISEGTLIPGYEYLTGNHSATVYRAGCDYVSSAYDGNYGIKSIGKTDVVSLDYVTNWDSNYGNAYLGVSLKGDDYAGNGAQTERDPDYYSSVYTTNHYTNKLTIDGAIGKVESYGLFNLGSKGKGYFSFVVRKSEEDSQRITIPAGTIFPSYAMTSLKAVTGNAIYMMYETQNDVTFIKQEDGTWAREIEATVSHAAIFGSSADAFAGIAIEGSSFASAPNTYPGDVKLAKTFARSENFLSHVLVDGERPHSGEGFLNVWSNFGYFCFRPGNNDATTITILAGCKIPTYNALALGYDEVYVVSQDITFEKNADGEWVLDNGIDAGEYETSISSVVFGRTNSDSWMLITLTESDYPSPNEVFNVGDVNNVVVSSNLYDKIVVDGYTLRARDGDKQPTINRWQADCLGLKIPGVDSNLNGAKKVTIRAGAQFPSYAYFTEGVEAYFVTTEEITFVNVGNSNGAWERQYEATFMADGEVVSRISYLSSQGLTAPAVPEKEGYRGEWEAYVAEGNITVNAVYTKKTYETAYTNISEVSDKDGFLILTLMNNDYQSAPSTWWGPNGNTQKDVLNAMKSMNFHLYGENGNEIALGSDAIINVWGLTGTLSFYVSGGIGSYSQVSFKKGCEIPSYTQIANGENFCFELIEDVTFIKQNVVWVRQGEAM